MKDHEGDQKQFTVWSQAGYEIVEPGALEQVNFGFYSPDGGTSGEMAMYWMMLTGNHRPAPYLKIFDGSFHALAQFKDVIDALAEIDGGFFTPGQFCRLLEQCGFTDAKE